jgi:NAD(P)-dependent dehydrogenase (short-subunit alcohol dehydrogenase family)
MRAIVTGGASGLGGLIAQELLKNDFVVHEWDIANGVDVANRISVMVAANHFFGSELHVLVNCAGCQCVAVNIRLE